jgi:hypothetical protein
MENVDKGIEGTLKHRAKIRKAKENLETVSADELQEAIDGMNDANLDYLCFIADLDAKQKARAKKIMHDFMINSNYQNVELSVFPYLASGQKAEKFLIHVYKDLDMDSAQAEASLNGYAGQVFKVLPELKKQLAKA